MSSFESEKTPQSRRWRVETGKPIDRAVAVVIAAAILHLMGLDAEVVRGIASLVA